MAIQVGDLTTNFIKTDVQDPNGLPDFDIQNSPFKLSEIVINDLINRLDNLENMIEFKVDTGSVISAIRMTEEALLITADQIAIFGQTTFLDYIRDQNGTVVGGIDPKITQIIGDKIRTGSIWSNAWIETDGASGMVMDLDNSDFYLGGSTNPTLQFSSDALVMSGDIVVQDRGSELGFFRTGTANVIDGVTVVGDGIIMGTPGIFGASTYMPNGYSFALSATSGDLLLGDMSGSHAYYSAQNGIFSLYSKMNIRDIGNPLSTGKFGYLSTGTAEYTNPQLVTGDGIIVGTFGILSASSAMSRGYSFVLDAETGDTLIGDIEDSNIFYSVSSGQLILNSKLLIRDIGDPLTTDQWGYLATGTASFNNASGASGSGCIVGSPGIYGLYNGTMMFGFDASTGNAIFSGTLVATDGTFSGSLSAADITGATGTFSGTLSSTKQVRCVPSTDALNNGFAGYFDNSSAASGNKNGIYGKGVDYGIHGLATASAGVGVYGQASHAAGVGVYGTSLLIGVGGYSTAGIGVNGQSTSATTGAGVSATNTSGGPALSVTGPAAFSTKITLPSGNGGTLYVSLSGADDYTAYDYYFT